MSEDVIKAIERLLKHKEIQRPEPNRLLLVLSPEEWKHYGPFLTMSREKIQAHLCDESQREES